MENRLLQVRVSSKRTVANDVCMLELVNADGSELPRFTAGAHVDLRLGPGLVRQYSLANDARETDRYVIGVLREPASRGGSLAVHETVQAGDLISISEPRNLFPLVSEEGPSLLFAGGIGVTPILSMARELDWRKADFTLHYCGRTLARMAFVDDILASGFAARARIHVDDGEDGQKLDLAAEFSTAPKDAHIYVCGPAGFIQAVTAAAAQAGWPQSQVHVESFAAAAAPSTEGELPFELRLQRSGCVVRVDPNETVLDAIRRAGVQIQTSCEQGICGSCMTTVLEGEPDHRDLVLSDEERSSGRAFLPCCSRSRSPVLVLDL